MADTSASSLPLGPEARLLFATAADDSSDPTILRLVQGPMDWTLFLQLAAHERAGAIVAARLARLRAPLPDQVQAELKAMATRSDLRMMMLSSRLDQTLAALSAAGIPVLLLKGAALGRTVYRSLPRRPMLDLDLLIPKERCHEAREVSLATGWIPGELEQLTEFYDGHYHMPPLSDARGGSFNLEIHSALFTPGHPFDWPLQQLWDRSQLLPGGVGRVPSPEDQLIHIALHYSWSHAARFGSWRTFRDVRTLAEVGNINWDGFTALARASRGGPAIYWALRLARSCVGAEIPAAVVAALRPALANPLFPMLERHFAGQWFPTDSACPSRWLDRWLWKLSMRPLALDDALSPWARDPIFQQGLQPSAREPMIRKLVRHIGSVGNYARYLHRIALGRGS